MRIAGGTVLRRYMHNLEKNIANKNKEENRLYSGRAFNRASENPIEAARALRVRKAMSDIKVYQDNLETANSIYENAESSIMKVSSIIQAVYEKLIQGAHGAINSDDAVIVAKTIDQYAEEMVQLMNIVVADRKIFGGLNNNSNAFRIEQGASGLTVYYHGIAVNTYQDYTLFPYSGTSYTDIGIGIEIGRDGERIDSQSALPITFNGAEILGCGHSSSSIFIDLRNFEAGKSYSMDFGVGGDLQTITFTVPVAGGLNPGDLIGDNADAKRALTDTMNSLLITQFKGNKVTIGAESGFIISNVSGNTGISVAITPKKMGESQAQYEARRDINITAATSGFSKNAIQLVLDAAQALKADDRLLAAQYADALFELQTNISLTIAKIGNTQEFIEFNLDRTTNNMMSLLDQQQSFEGSKPEEQITLIKVLEALFSAQLQMGAGLIPMSIFNFMK